MICQIRLLYYQTIQRVCYTIGTIYSVLVIVHNIFDRFCADFVQISTITIREIDI